MKTWHIVLLIVALIVLFASAAGAQTADASKAVPKYDVAAEVTIKGTVIEVSERNCPVSGGRGFHFMLKPEVGQPIEVHVTLTKVMKAYDMVIAKDDQVVVIGSKVKFEGVETIFARKVMRGDEIFTFRNENGKPIW